MSNSKLSPHSVWLFSFGSIAAAIGASYAASGLGQKAAAGIFFAIVGLGGFASTYLTRAKMGAAVGAFLAGSVVAAVSYYFLVAHMVSAMTSAMVDVTSGGAAHSQGVMAGNAFGGMFGIFVAVIIFLETIVAGIGGAFAGSRARGGSTGAVLAGLARSAQ
jgi:hypothetical protein